MSIKATTSWSPVERTSDWATEASLSDRIKVALNIAII